MYLRPSAGCGYRRWVMKKQEKRQKKNVVIGPLFLGDVHVVGLGPGAGAVWWHLTVVGEVQNNVLESRAVLEEGPGVHPGVHAMGDLMGWVFLSSLLWTVCFGFHGRLSLVRNQATYGVADMKDSRQKASGAETTFFTIHPLISLYLPDERQSILHELLVSIGLRHECHDMTQEPLLSLLWCFGMWFSSAQHNGCAFGTKHSGPMSITRAFRFAQPSP